MFKTLCTPAHLYLVLSIITVIVAFFNQFSAMAIVIKMIWIFLWTYLLNCLCKKGFSTISWILVLIPFVAILGTIMLDLEGHKVHHLVVTTKEGYGLSQVNVLGEDDYIVAE